MCHKGTVTPTVFSCDCNAILAEFKKISSFNKHGCSCITLIVLLHMEVALPSQKNISGVNHHNILDECVVKSNFLSYFEHSCS